MGRQVADDLLVATVADQAIRAAGRTSAGRVRYFGVDVIVVVSFLDPLHLEVREVQNVGGHFRCQLVSLVGRYIAVSGDRGGQAIEGSAPCLMFSRSTNAPVAADGPLQPVVRPPSLTHIAQVCGGWTIKNLVNAKLRPGLA